MTVRVLAALAAFALAATPATAQDATAQDIGTPAENLDCAIWAAYMAGTNEDPEAEAAFAIALSWFTGLYEGQTGRSIDEPLVARATQLTDEDILTIGGLCVPRFEAYGNRLSVLGDRLQGME